MFVNLLAAATPLDTAALILGIAAGLAILGSMTFKCVTVKRNILMRAINTLGSALFVADGVCMVANGTISGWSLIACNLALLGFNVYYMAKMVASLKKGDKADEATTTAPETEPEPEQKAE